MKKIRDGERFRKQDVAEDAEVDIPVEAPCWTSLISKQNDQVHVGMSVMVMQQILCLTLTTVSTVSTASSELNFKLPL